VDLSKELGSEESFYFQSLIGIGVLHWMVELGCIDICCGFQGCFPMLNLTRDNF